MKILISLFGLVLLFCTTIVYARMYQWVEPDSDTTQLSGKPPAWYRSTNGGPRVFVFDNGRLIDDTAVEVSDVVRQRMRRQAFVLAEEDRQKAQEKIARSQELKQKFEETVPEEDTQISEIAEDESISDIVTDEIPLYLDEQETVEKDSDAIDKTTEELRKLISDWEQSQSEEAKQTLENQ